MNYINITVRGKIARAEGRARVVCGNSDYAVRFDFDAEWSEYTVKTARFVTEDGSYNDVQFTGSDCAVPILRNTRTLLVGVFAGNLRTTTAALIHAVPCITDPDGTPADPTPDVYAQLMERFNAMEAPAAVLYTAQELTDEQKATARENIGVATPDWEQNDATAADYVKNRTHYSEVIGETPAGYGYSGWSNVTMEREVPIPKISVSRVIYKNVQIASVNDAIVEYVVGDHRLSFNRESRAMTATPDNLGYYDVMFIKPVEAIHKLPIKYIPNEVALTKNLPQSDWNEVNSSSASYIKNKPSPSDVTPSASGTASAGTSGDYARADHVHPKELPECSDADAGKVLTVAGNADVQWQLPSAGADTSLGMTGATVGQIAKITAVDDSGKPTAWEAVDMPSGGGGDLSWIEVVDITTAEQTQKLTISVDKDGRPISQYNALWMVFSILFPADATQTSNNGAPWIYPFPKTGDNAYRYITTVASWKTIKRTLTYAWAGLPRITWSSATSAQTIFDVDGDPDFLSGLCVYLPSSSDHIPAGTRVRIAVLSKGVTA